MQRRVIVGDKCVFQQEATFGTKQQGITSMETLRIKTEIPEDLRHQWRMITRRVQATTLHLEFRHG